MRVLYAEDERETGEMVTEILSDYFDEVIFCNNGEEALEAYQNQKNFDLFITDINMPKLTGLEVIKKIREVDDKIPIMILSARREIDTLLESISLHVDEFVIKPVDLELFLEKIQKIINKLQTQRELQETSRLLSEYKEVIDESTILSKTNPKGIITFANDAFCKISGYSREELLGKNHNIVRHPDIPSEYYAQMWRDLKNKKAWRGSFKNRAKDGSSYYVSAYIAPIVDLNGNIVEYIAVRSDVTELEHYRQDIEKQLKIATQDIVDTQREVVFTMGAIGEARSKETGLHVKRVAEYSYLLAKLYGLSEEEATLLKQASPMHDIGKVGIPDNILNKSGKLDAGEWAVMQTHSKLGYDMLKHSQKNILKTAAIIAHEHHEKWNGSGYPRGLREDEIHIYGRITAVADVFDALGHDRVYKKAWPLEEILALFKDEKAKQFDPVLIDIFLDNLEKFLEIKSRLDSI